MTALGIVGGLSPETTVELYLKLIEKSRNSSRNYPHIVIDSAPLDFSIEDEMIVHGKNQHRLLPFLIDSVKRLQETDLIAIPCNTAHIFIEELRKESNVPIISVVDEVVRKARQMKFRRVGLLATSCTVSSGIYCDNEIEFVLPNEKDQKDVSRIILGAIRNNLTTNDKAKLQEIMHKFCKNDAIILACTELQRVLKGNHIDSFDILVEAVFNRMEV